MMWIFLASILCTHLVDGTREFTLVANGKECAGTKLHIGNFENIQECAGHCAGVSPLFTFGSSECRRKYWWSWFGDILLGKQCSCSCQMTSSVRGECTIVKNSGINLYRFNVEVPELCPISLPQYTTDKVCIKQNQIDRYKAKMFYKFSQPSKKIHFPRLEQKEEVVKVKLAFSTEMFLTSAAQAAKAVVAQVAAGLMGFFKGSELQSYEQHHIVYRKAIDALKILPEVDTPTEHEGFTDTIKDGKWQEDKIFAQRRLAGICPYFLRQVTDSDDIGMRKDNLEDLLNPDFDWNKAVVETIGNDHIKSLSQAINAGRVYVLYYEPYNDIPHTPSAEPDRKAIKSTSTITLFATDERGDLQVVAIQEDYKRDSKVHSTISPKAEWERAKALVEMEFWGVCQAVGHLYESHIRMEIICEAQPKHLSPTHPLYEVMMQHCKGTATLGYFKADRSLLTPGGGFSFSNFGYTGALHMMNNAFDTDHYDNWDMELRLRKQGLINDNLQYYPYRDDGLELWHGVKVFAEKIINAYYVTDEDVVNDYEVQGFVNELSKDGTKKPDGGNGQLRGFPTKLKSKVELTTLLSRFLFPVIHHHAANYPAYPYGIYFPMVSGTLYEPTGKGDILSMLPNSTSIIALTTTGAVVSTYRMNKMFGYSNELTDEKARSIVLDTFVYFNTKIQGELVARNEKRFREGKLTFQFFEPKWLTNSIHV